MAKERKNKPKNLVIDPLSEILLQAVTDWSKAEGAPINRSEIARAGLHYLFKNKDFDVFRKMIADERHLSRTEAVSFAKLIPGKCRKLALQSIVDVFLEIEQTG